MTRKDDLDVDLPEGMGSTEWLAMTVKEIADLHREGALDAEASHALAGSRFLLDLDGKVWTVGLTSGDWYHCDNGRWHPSSDAPDPDRLVRLTPERTLCHRCGNKVEGDAPCGSCGAGPTPTLDSVDDTVTEALRRFLERTKSLVPETLAD